MDSNRLASALADDVGTGLFERSAVAIVVEGGQVRVGEREPESADGSARYSRPRRKVTWTGDYGG